MTEIEIKIIADNKDAVKGVRELADETQKLGKIETQQNTKRKGLIENEIQRTKQLTDSRNRASNTESLKQYNRLLEDSKKKLQELEGAGLKVEQSGQSMMQSMGKWLLTLGLVTTALNALKNAFMSTVTGINLFNKAGAATKQILYDIVTGLNISIPKIKEAIRIQGELNALRVEEYRGRLMISKLDREYQELYVKSLDQTIEKGERLKLIDEALVAHNKSIDIEVENTKKLLELNSEAVNRLRGDDEKLIAEGYALMTKLENLDAQRVSQTKRLMSTRSGIIADEIKKEKEWQEMLKRWWDEIDFENRKRANMITKTGLFDTFAIDEETFSILKTRLDKVNKLYEDIQNEGLEIVKKSGEKAKKENDAIDTDNKNRTKIAEDERKEKLQALKDGLQEVQNVLTQWVDQEVQIAQRRRELLDTRISEVQNELERETELYTAGYASNVAAKQKELDDLKALRAQALRNEEDALRKQRLMESIAQGINIFSAVTQIIKSYTEAFPLIGIALAAGTIAAMFTLLASAKSRSAEITKLAEGGHGEVRGRTHAQGGERFLSHVEIEHGERWGVLNRSASRKYGPVFDNMIDAFNKHEIKTPLGSTNINNVVVENEGPNSRLDQVNKQLKELNVRENIIETGNKTIIKKGNNLTVIRHR